MGKREGEAEMRNSPRVPLSLSTLRLSVLPRTAYLKQLSFTKIKLRSQVSIRHDSRFSRLPLVVQKKKKVKKPTAFVIHFSPDTDLSEDRKLMRLVLYFLNSIYNIRLNVDVQ